MVIAEVRQLVKDLKSNFFNFFVNVLAGSILTPRITRSSIYKLWGIKTKSNGIAPRCFFGGKRVTIGQGTFVNYKCFFDNSASIKIGQNCSIGMEVLFCTSSHEIGDEDKRSGKGFGEPIQVEDGCWIGARATILPGVTIGKGCIIASGAVVKNDCKPNGLYAGVPAKRIKDLSSNKAQKNEV
jgi:maltose O-acetyltransferase